MRVFLIAIFTVLTTAFPLTNAFAQSEREPRTAIFFFLSSAEDHTTRPSTLNPNCWKDKSTAGTGFSFDFRTSSPVIFQTGWHFLGSHQNENCTPSMELRTSVIPFTVAFKIPLGSERVFLAPKVGFSYMTVNGDYGTLSDSDSSIKPTVGLLLEGSLSDRWAFRGQLDKYTGRTNLFGRGEFKQDFVVFSLGGVVKW